jgi:ribonuclease BN (tRNA processing enzyme)
MLLLDQERGNLQVYDHNQVPIQPLSDNVVRIHILKSYAHPRQGVYIYRIEWREKSVVIATDTEGYIGVDQRLVQFAQDTDLLIHDAHFSQQDYVAGKQGWGHSTPEMACEVARQCGARKLALIHHAPTYSDDMLARMEQDAQQLFSAAFTAYEGLEIVL